jgi:hypothetical protein
VYVFLFKIWVVRHARAYTKGAVYTQLRTTAAEQSVNCAFYLLLPLEVLLHFESSVV